MSEPAPSGSTIIDAVNELEKTESTQSPENTTSVETQIEVPELNTNGESEGSEDDDSSEYTYESDVVDEDLEKQWQDIVAQFNMITFLVLIPLGGRALGRKFIYYVWTNLAERLF